MITMSPHLDLFEDAFELAVAPLSEGGEVGPVDGGLGRAAGAEVVVDLVSLRGEDTHTAAVKPVLAPVTADVEPDEKQRSGAEPGGGQSPPTNPSISSDFFKQLILFTILGRYPPPPSGFNLALAALH